jgi:hypothetical protein
MVVPDEQEYFADTRLASSQAEAAKVNSYGLRKEVDRATKCIQDGLKWPEEKVSGNKRQFVKQDPPLSAADKASLIQQVTDDIMSTPPARTPANILNWFLAKCIENHSTRLSVAVSILLPARR